MEMQQEYLMKLQALEQEANQLGEQAKIIDQQVMELRVLGNNVGKLGEANEEEIFSELGKGIFLKSKLIKSDLLVEVGSKVFVPKTPEEVKKVIEDQVGKLEQVKGEIANKIEEINTELNNVIQSAEKAKEIEEKVGKGKDVDKKGKGKAPAGVLSEESKGKKD